MHYESNHNTKYGQDLLYIHILITANEKTNDDNISNKAALIYNHLLQLKTPLAE